MAHISSSSSSNYVDGNNNNISSAAGSRPRQTPRWMSKFERARTLGFEAERIAKGGAVYVPISANDYAQQDPLQLANNELERRVIPVTIQRLLPNHQEETWHISDMVVEKPHMMLLRPLDTSPVQIDPYAPLVVRDFGPPETTGVLRRQEPHGRNGERDMQTTHNDGFLFAHQVR
jgi:DNA-directed RNA polymerase subunit K/omega